VDDEALLSNDSVKQQWKDSDRCYAMAQYIGVSNGVEDVFCGRCGGYITSMKPVTGQKNRQVSQCSSVPDKKCYKIVK
jgi:hypothetical protein